jgi:uncharacterized protein YjbJ (UPF0337 family)
MNHEQFEQSWNQLKGQLLEKWGNITAEDLIHIDGDRDKFQGVILARYGEMKEEVREWADRWYAHWAGWYQGYVPEKPRIA